jgi:hypothetical protein
MMKRHDKRGRVAEPVQVYLAGPDRDRLERLAQSLGLTKSDVLRRGLEALESRAQPGRKPARPRVRLPTFRGRGLQPGVDLDDSASLLDLMNEGDASR